MKIAENDIVVANQNFKRLMKGTEVRILAVNETKNTVDCVVVSGPEIWLTDVPMYIFQNSID